MKNLVLPLAEARASVEAQARELKPRGAEHLPLLEARGRILAESICADRDFPPFPRATRDGYAVRAADVARVPVRLALAGEIKAGSAAERPLEPGECYEIMTGAPLPPGADAVVMVEYTARDGDGIVIQRTVAEGENFVPRGAEGRAGDELLRRGTRLDHVSIALAASVGQAQVSVFARPQVAILATGDELVDVTAVPSPVQIRNSNSYSLAAQVAAAGATPVILPVAADNIASLERLIVRGLKSDLLLLAGGVSMGKYDLVEQVLASLDAEFFFTGALIQPGKPVVFGRVPSAGRLFYGLPGNPVSTMVTFDLFVRPVLDSLSGASPRPLQFLRARLKSDFRTKTGLTRFLPAMLTGALENCEVEPVRWHGSGDLAASVRANCYLVVPPDRERLAAGEMVSVLPTCYA